MKVAVIDGKINKFRQDFFMQNTRYSKVFLRETKEINFEDYTHADFIASIIQEYTKLKVVYWITILNQENIGSLDYFVEALTWCYENHINVINLSLGIVQSDRIEPLYRICNKLIEQDTLIFAAFSNSKDSLLTQPAKYPGIIGCCYRGNFLHKNRICIHIPLKYKLPRLNSYTCAKEMSKYIERGIV